MRVEVKEIIFAGLLQWEDADKPPFLVSKKTGSTVPPNENTIINHIFHYRE